MNDLTDKELALSIELAQTRAALSQMQSRACQNELHIAAFMGGEVQKELRELFVEQQRREAAKKEVASATNAK